MKKALFLDRDGVINVEKNYLFRIEEFEFIPETLNFMRRAIHAGYEIIVVTNQAGIAKGKYTVDDYLTLNRWMISELKSYGIPVLDTYFSPYHKDGVIKEYARDDVSRKPNPGMILQAQNEYDIDLRNSILVGDRFSDILAGYHAEIGLLYLIEADYNFRDYQHEDYRHVSFVKIRSADEITI